MATGGVSLKSLILSFSLVFIQYGTYTLQPVSADRYSVRHAEKLKPTVVISVLVRNKAHSLPFFFNYVENLDYPKDRIAIWIHTDRNKDNSETIIRQWVQHVEHLYHTVNFTAESTPDFPDQEEDCHWSELRFQHVIELRQKALDFARQAWADYLFMIDADVILMNKNTLSILMEQKKTIVAPKLNATASEFYSNFWGGMDEQGYYKRVPEYKPILYGHWQGCFEVGNVHTAVLINLKDEDSSFLAYYPPPQGYDGPLDDIIIFAHSAMYHEVSLNIVNTEFFGFVPVPMQNNNYLEQEQEQFIHIKCESAIYVEPMEKLTYVEQTPPPVKKTKLGFDQVYMINLDRRPDRRLKMNMVFDELGIDAKLMSAVDGKQLNQSYLDKIGIKMLDGYQDPYHGRILTKGEIGCFLSHWQIWQDVLQNNYQKVLVFEDDLRFEPYFKSKLELLMEEIEEKQLDWELVYLGRKRLNHNDEKFLEDSESLVFPKYSYWTLSYMLSLNGAHKLVDQKPLGRLIPVDEYIPAMFDDHPVEEWKTPFEPRDLQAYSVHPLLIFPTHYTGESGYITDTDHSEIIDTSADDKNAKQGPLTGPSTSDRQTTDQQSRLGDFGKDEL